MQPNVGLELVEGPDLIVTLDCPECGHISRTPFHDCPAGETVVCSCGAVTYTFDEDDLHAAQHQLDNIKRDLANLKQRFTLRP